MKYPVSMMLFCLLPLLCLCGVNGCSTPVISAPGKESFDYFFGSTLESQAHDVDEKHDTVRREKSEKENETDDPRGKSGKSAVKKSVSSAKTEKRKTFGNMLASPFSRAKRFFRKPSEDFADSGERSEIPESDEFDESEILAEHDSVVESDESKASDLRSRNSPAGQPEENSRSVPPVARKKLLDALSKDQWTRNVELDWALEKLAQSGEIPSPDSLVVGHNTSGESARRKNFERLNASSHSKRPLNDSLGRNKEDADKGPISLHRWYHGLLEEEILENDSQRLKTEAARILVQSGPRGVSGANAAILLARGNVPESKAFLLESIFSQELSINQRSAALEAFGSLENTADEELVRLYDTFCEKSLSVEGKTQQQFRPGVRELTMETLHALARRRAPDTLACFRDALESADASIRLTAAKIWCDHPPRDDARYDPDALAASIPDTLAKLVHDPGDSRIRIAALGALARWNHPALDRYLYEGSCDPQHPVRLAAIDAMGVAGSPRSLELLRENAGNSSAAIRVRAARALRRRGALADLFRMAEDKDASVRGEVAQSLHDSSDEKTRELMKRMLADRNVEVQTHALETLADWPENESGPIFLAEMGSLSATKREKATQLLGRFWSPAADFDPGDQRGEIRAAALEELKVRFFADPRFQDSEQSDSGFLAGAGDENRSFRNHESAPQRRLDRLALEKGRRAFSLYQDERATREEKTRAREDLLALGGKLALVLEYLAFHENRAISGDVFQTMLPETNPEFAFARDLNHETIAVRRAAAGKLLEESRLRSFGPLLVSKVYEIGVHEEDVLTLMALIEMFGNHPGEIADAFAIRALDRDHPELRRRACEVLAASDDVSVIGELLPMLDDVSEEIVRTSLRALSRQAGTYFAESSAAAPRQAAHTSQTRRRFGELTQDEQYEARRVAEAIRPTLLRPEIHLQTEAALALCAWEDSAGVEALQRLSYSREHHVRISVANAIATAHDPRLAEILIMLLDDENGSARSAALHALPKLLKADHGNPTGAISVSLPERIGNWKRWAQVRLRG